MIVTPGSTGISADVFLVDDTGRELTGKVAADFPPLYYSLGGGTAAVLVPLSDLASETAAWAAGGVHERPGGGGAYRVCLPDAAFAAAGVDVSVYGAATGKRVVPRVIPVQYAPADVRKLLGTAWLTPGTAGTPDVNVKLVAAGAINSAAFADDTGLQNVRANVLSADSTDDSNVFLDAGASSANGFYASNWIRFTSGGQSGKTFLIIGYSGSSKAATVLPPMTGTFPGSGDGYVIIPAAFGNANVAAITGSETAASALSILAAFYSVNGFIPAYVLAMANNAVTAAALADGAIDTAAFAPGATVPRVTLVDTTTANTDMLTAAGVRTAVGLASADLDAQLAGIAAGADPLLKAVPGTYAQGTAGYALGRVGSARVTAVSPVSQSGPVVVVAGDDYRHADGRAITWTADTPDLWPDLTGATLTFVAGDALATAAAAVVEPTGNQSFYAELTAAQTAVIAAAGRRESYYVRAALADGTVITLVESTVYAARPGVG